VDAEIRPGSRLGDDRDLTHWYSSAENPVVL